MAKARVPTEAQEGVALSAWLTRMGIAHVHIPNGIKIGGDRRGAAGQIACLKDQGLQPGAPDYLVFPSVEDPPKRLSALTRGVAIELKRRDAPRGGRWGVVESQQWLRPEQVQWLERLDGLGWRCRACAGSKDAIEFLQSLGFGAVDERVESVDMSETQEAAPAGASDAVDAVIVALGIGGRKYTDAAALTSKDLQRATGLDAATLRKTLAKLGPRIVKTGQKRGTRYALAQYTTAELEAAGYDMDPLGGGEAEDA